MLAWYLHLVPRRNIRLGFVLWSLQNLEHQEIPYYEYEIVMKLKKKKQNANKNGSYIALEQSKETFVEQKNQIAVHGNENRELVNEVRIKIYLKILSFLGDNLLCPQPQSCKFLLLRKKGVKNRSLSRHVCISFRDLAFIELILWCWS